MRRYDLGMESVPLTGEIVSSYDALLISTAHAAVDYELIARHALLVVDTRNALARHAELVGDRWVKA
jgi:UDP-N-acetyl-D-glucosamine dehydrogenase